MRIDTDSPRPSVRPVQFIDQSNIAPAWQRKWTEALLRHDACGRLSRAGQFANTLRNTRPSFERRVGCNREKKEKRRKRKKKGEIAGKKRQPSLLYILSQPCNFYVKMLENTIRIFLDERRLDFSSAGI